MQSVQTGCTSLLDSRGNPTTTSARLPFARSVFLSVHVSTHHLILHLLIFSQPAVCISAPSKLFQAVKLAVCTRGGKVIDWATDYLVQDFSCLSSVNTGTCSRENQNTHFMFNNYFFPSENHAVFEIMRKNKVQPKKPTDDNITRRTHFVC